MDVVSYFGISEPVSSLSHLMAAIFFVFWGYKLIAKSRGNGLRVAAVSLFVITNIILFSMSGVYHLFDKGHGGKYVFQVLDHDAIYLVIAGIFTPIHIILTRGISRWGTITLVWALSVSGIVITSIFLSTMPSWVSLICFLGMGWIGLFSFFRVLKVCRKSAKNIFISGILFTVGALIDGFNFPVIWSGVIGPHEIFHFFVVAGIAYNWRIMFDISEIPISNQLVGIISEYPGSEFHGIFTSEKPEFCAPSKEDLKVQMIGWARDNYYSAHLPKDVNFRYSQEEIHKI